MASKHQIAVFRRKMEGLHVKMGTLHIRIEDLQPKMDGLHAKMDTLHARIESLQPKMDGLHAKMETCTSGSVRENL